MELILNWVSLEFSVCADRGPHRTRQKPLPRAYVIEKSSLWR